MATAPARPKPKPTFGCAYIFLTLVLLLLGWAFIAAGRQLMPGASADAQLFRSDPSCSSDLKATPPAGACKTFDAEILSAVMRPSGGMSRTHSESPFVYVRLADGTIHDGELDRSAGNVFVNDVAAGQRARAQFFHGQFVRVATDKDTSETVDAPDIDAETASEMPWVGLVLLVLAGVLVAARIAAVRRAG